MTGTGPIVLIADDLTGALDAAAPFAQRGYTAQVVPAYAVANWQAGATGVVVLCSDTRDGAPAGSEGRLADCIAQAVEAVPSLIGVKVDSLLRGTPARDIAAISAGLGHTGPVFIVPAYPAQGRVTRDCCVFVAGIALGCTEHHPDGQAPTVRSLATATGLRTVTFGVEAVRAPEFPADLEAAVEGGPAAVIFDAETEDDLRRIVEGGSGVAAALWVGSAGVFEHIAARRAEGLTVRADQPAEVPTAPRILVAVGSASSAAAAQLAALEDAHIRITSVSGPAEIMEAGAGLRRDLKLSAVAAVRPRLRAAHDGPLDDLHSRLVTAVVAEVRDSFDALVVVGGATANNVFHTIGVQGLRVTAAPGQGMAAGFTEPAPHIQFVSKAGSFGEPSVLIQAVSFLQSRSKGTP